MKTITRFVVSAVLPSVLSLYASALELTCAPGTLSGMVAEPSAVTELVLKGQADASDLLYIGSEMPSLRRLDLSGCIVSDGIPAGAFAGTKLAAVVFPQSGRFTVGDFAFAGTRLQNVDIPETVSALGTGAFAGCPELETATVRGTSTEGYTFANCSALKKVTLVDIATIANGDFADCPSLATVEGSHACISIGASAFRGAVSLAAFDFGDRLRSLGASSYSGSGLREVSLAGCPLLDVVGERAFADSRALTSFSVSDKARIGRGALMGCTALEHLSMGSANNVPDYFATGAGSLKSVELPSEAASLGRYALKGASSVTAVNLPEGISLLNDHAMDGMTSLKSISAEDVAVVPALGEGVFEGIEQAEVLLTVGDGMVDDFSAAPVWQDFMILGKSGVSVPDTPHTHSIRGRFNGKILEIETDGDEISCVELFDAAGRFLMSLKVSGTTAYADTSSSDTNLYIDRCTTASSAVAILKLAR